MAQPITNEDDAKFIADMIRDGTLTGGRMETAFQALEAFRAQQGIETSPFELPEPREVPIFSSSLGLPRKDKFLPEERALANQGVDILSGSPVGRFPAGFAQNEALRANDLQQRLTEHFGQDITVSKGPLGLEFIHPETGRRTLVDEVTATFRDLADVAGPAIPTAGAIAGSLGGAPGAALGGFIGEGVRRGVGNALGVRDESLGEAGVGSMVVGAAEGVLQKGGDVAVATGQRIKRFFKPRAISPEAAESALNASQADQAIADEIAKRTGQPLQPFTSQLSNDPTLVGAQRSALTSEQTGEALQTQLRQNETTLESFFDELNPVTDAPNTATGRSIQGEARGQTQPRVQAEKETTDALVQELDELTAAIPVAENSAIVNQLSKAATRARVKVKNVEDDAWDDARAAYGHNPDTALSDVKIPIDNELETIVARLQAEATEAIDPATRAGKKALVPKKLRPADEADAAARAADDELAEALGVNPEGLTPGEIDLHQLQVHLSGLRRRLRLAKKGEVATDPQGRDIARIEDSLVAQRNAHLKETNPELLELIEEAETLTAKRADLFDNAIVGKLVRKEGGEWILTDKELIGRTIGSGDKEAIDHLVAALSKHPAGLPTLQRTFMQFYRKQVVRNGIPNATLHSEFIKVHGGTIDALIPGPSRIRQLGEFEKIVSHRIQRFTDFEKAVQRKFRGRIQNIAPERIAEDVLGKRFSVKEVGQLMSLAEAAGVKQQYQAAIAGQLRRKFVTSNSGLQLQVMDRFVGANKERLQTIFGAQYVRDMELLLSGLKTVRTTDAGIATTRNPTLFGALLEGVARVTVARPLSPGGVGLTKGFRFNQRAARRVLSEAIADPKVLRAIVSQGKLQATNRNVGRLLAVLGGSSLVVEAAEEFPEIDPKP